MVLSDILGGLLILLILSGYVLILLTFLLILSGYVLIPLTFLLIILLMKRSRKKNKMDIILNLCLGQRYLEYNLL